MHPLYGDAAAERSSLAAEMYRLNDRDWLVAAEGLSPHASLESHIEDLLRHAVSLQPASASTHRRLGIWLHEQDAGRHNRLREAAEALSAAVRLLPADGETQLLLALTMHRRGEGSAASQAYRRALRVDPTNAEVYRLYGTLMHNTDDLPRADGALRAACRLDLGAELRGAVRSEWEHVLQLQGRLDEAASLSCAADSALAAASRESADLQPWRMLNELTLPMYIWRQREQVPL